MVNIVVSNDDGWVIVAVVEPDAMPVIPCDDVVFHGGRHIRTQLDTAGMPVRVEQAVVVICDGAASDQQISCNVSADSSVTIVADVAVDH